VGPRPHGGTGTAHTGRRVVDLRAHRKCGDDKQCSKGRSSREPHGTKDVLGPPVCRGPSLLTGVHSQGRPVTIVGQNEARDA
jgi:hypothetical protein